MTPPITRRSMLAGTGAAGALALGVRRVRQPPAFTAYTYAQPLDGEDEGIAEDGRRLRVSWYATYNGEVVHYAGAPEDATDDDSTSTSTEGEEPTNESASMPTFVEHLDGPALGLANVLPGDAGTLLVGLEALAPEGVEEGLDVWFRPTIVADEERGLTEPEILAPGEDGTDQGELGGAVQVQIWHDDGLLGACDGRIGLDETVLAAGPATMAIDVLSDGRLVVPCLAPGERRCLGLAWDLPAATGNAVQTDALRFDLAFVARDCGEGDPFVGAETEVSR